MKNFLKKVEKQTGLTLRKMLILIIILAISFSTIQYLTIENKNNVKANDNLVLDTAIAKKIKPENYGDWAEYKVDLNDNGSYEDDWKIFYNDGTYVYLIAADYLKNSKIPEEAGMTTNGEYNAYWTDDSNFANKSGMGDVSTSVANQFMLRKYKNDIEYANVTDINSKATAILLDTKIWEDFALGFEGSFAYGSPTVEMWVDSWNQKGYGKLYDNVVRESDSLTFDNCFHNYGYRGIPPFIHYYETKGYGYKVGTSNNNMEEQLNISTDANGYNDELYFPHTSITDTTDKYWFATPTYRKFDWYYYCGLQAECIFGENDITVSKSGETVKAKDLREGNSIVYYNIDTGELEEGTVKKVYIHQQATSFIQYTFDDETYLKATDYHPIYTKDGWKSFTERNGYPKPQVGDEVKTTEGWKTITAITPFSGLEDCYDFAVQKESGEEINNYFANDTLVKSAIDTPEHDSDFYIFYDEYSMDCLVSCSYEGIVGGTQLNIEESNAALRPIVVLPTSAPGYKDSDGVWHLSEEPGRLVVHHYIEGMPDETKLVDDEITEELEDGTHYVTNPLDEDKYDTDMYEYTGKTTGDPTEGEIESGKTTEVTYWYRLRKHIITTEVKGTGGHITGEGEEIEEEVEHLKNSEKDIIITPNEGYYIKRITVNGNEIEFTPEEDGTYTMDKFKEVKEDKHIVVEFEVKKEPIQPEPTEPKPTEPTPSEPDDEQEPSEPTITPIQPEDATTKDKNLPNTGKNQVIVVAIIITCIIGVVSFIKYKRMNLQ